jgi:acylphosphatase
MARYDHTSDSSSTTRLGLSFWSTKLISQIQVEGEVQGEDTLVQKILKDVDNGPRLAKVVKLEKSEIDSQDGEQDFVVRR